MGLMKLNGNVTYFVLTMISIYSCNNSSHKDYLLNNKSKKDIDSSCREFLWLYQQNQEMNKKIKDEYNAVNEDSIFTIYYSLYSIDSLISILNKDTSFCDSNKVIRILLYNRNKQGKRIDTIIAVRNLYQYNTIVYEQFFDYGKPVLPPEIEKKSR